jgi:hypothetical protein
MDSHWPLEESVSGNLISVIVELLSELVSGVESLVSLLGLRFELGKSIVRIAFDLRFVSAEWKVK